MGYGGASIAGAGSRSCRRAVRAWYNREYGSARAERRDSRARQRHATMGAAHLRHAVTRPWATRDIRPAAANHLLFATGSMVLRAQLAVPVRSVAQCASHRSISAALSRFAGDTAEGEDRGARHDVDHDRLRGVHIPKYRRAPNAACHCARRDMAPPGTPATTEKRNRRLTQILTAITADSLLDPNAVHSNV
jgi:hypothetical protein